MANDKRTHILVVSDPPVAPGYLPRLRYLCDYLDRKGYAVTLLTETLEPLPFAHNYPIETIRMYSAIETSERHKPPLLMLVLVARVIHLFVQIPNIAYQRHLKCLSYPLCGS